jgi:hypothetical protein
MSRGQRQLSRGRRRARIGARQRGAGHCREQLLRRDWLRDDLITGRVLRVRLEIGVAYQYRPHPGVPVFHLVTQGKSIHRLEEHLRDQKFHLALFGHLERLIPRAGGFHFVARDFFQDVKGRPKVLRSIHNENIHVRFIAPFQAASAAAGFS